MPRTRPTARAAALVVLAGVALSPATVVSRAAPVVQVAAERPAPPEVEARFTDGTSLRVKLLDEVFELKTRYGTLRIPATDVRRVEFATRTPADVVERCEVLISNLNHPDFAAREKATAELRDLRERAVGPLAKAARHPDAEISRRAADLLRLAQARHPGGQAEARTDDVVHTDDSKIAGQLTARALRVRTVQFGEQDLRLADVRLIRSGADEPPAVAVNAPPGPGNMMTYANQFGKEFAFTVTYQPAAAQPVFTAGPLGGPPGVVGQRQGQPVWGTDVYTLDSGLAAAAAHAGLVQPGGTAVVRVRVVPSPAGFAGTPRNGVNSMQYGPFNGGAFEFVRK